MTRTGAEYLDDPRDGRAAWPGNERVSVTAHTAPSGSLQGMVGSAPGGRETLCERYDRASQPTHFMLESRIADEEASGSPLDDFLSALDPT